MHDIWKKKSTTTIVGETLKTRDQNTKPAFQWWTHELPGGEPKQQNSKPTNLGSEPTNPDSETHEPSSDWTHKCGSSGEVRFPQFSLFYLCRPGT